MSSTMISVLIPLKRLDAKIRMGIVPHILEHMIVRGCGYGRKDSLALAVETLGGMIAAQTNPEYTHFSVMVRSGSESNAMDLLSKRLFVANFSTEDAEREYRDVCHELERMPLSYFTELNLYKQLIGEKGSDPNNIRQMLTSILDIHRATYQPVDFQWVIAGPFDLHRMASCLRHEICDTPHFPVSDIMIGCEFEQSKMKKHHSNSIMLALRSTSSNDLDDVALDFLAMSVIQQVKQRHAISSLPFQILSKWLSHHLFVLVHFRQVKQDFLNKMTPILSTMKHAITQAVGHDTFNMIYTDINCQSLRLAKQPSHWIPFLNELWYQSFNPFQFFDMLNAQQNMSYDQYRGFFNEQYRFDKIISVNEMTDHSSGTILENLLDRLGLSDCEEGLYDVNKRNESKIHTIENLSGRKAENSEFSQAPFLNRSENKSEPDFVDRISVLGQTSGIKAALMDRLGTFDSACTWTFEGNVNNPDVIRTVCLFCTILSRQIQPNFAKNQWSIECQRKRDACSVSFVSNDYGVNAAMHYGVTALRHVLLGEPIPDIIGSGNTNFCQMGSDILTQWNVLGHSQAIPGSVQKIRNVAMTVALRGSGICSPTHLDRLVSDIPFSSGEYFPEPRYTNSVITCSQNHYNEKNIMMEYVIPGAPVKDKDEAIYHVFSQLFAHHGGIINRYIVDSRSPLISGGARWDSWIHGGECILYATSAKQSVEWFQEVLTKHIQRIAEGNVLEWEWTRALNCHNLVRSNELTHSSRKSQWMGMYLLSPSVPHRSSSWNRCRTHQDIIDSVIALARRILTLPCFWRIQSDEIKT